MFVVLDMVHELKSMEPKPRGRFGFDENQSNRLFEAERLVELAEGGCSNSYRQARRLLEKLLEGPNWAEAQELGRRLSEID